MIKSHLLKCTILITALYVIFLSCTNATDTELTSLPVAIASTTTPTVSINDTIRLQGTATDLYGTIVIWEWDVGNSGVFVSTSPDSGYIGVAPSIADSAYQCVLRVTDDDGNIGLDTTFINILKDVPTCSASTTTLTISINDTIRLQGTSTDLYGTIVNWEWDVGNTGSFISILPDSDYICITPSIADSA